jgi:hypothetical protein
MIFVAIISVATLNRSDSAVPGMMEKIVMEGSRQLVVDGEDPNVRT